MPQKKYKFLMPVLLVALLAAGCANSAANNPQSPPDANNQPAASPDNNQPAVNNQQTQPASPPANPAPAPQPMPAPAPVAPGY